MQLARRKNLMVIAPCLVVIAIMCGIVAYSPTLYRLFCSATGFGGTTIRADAYFAFITQVHRSPIVCIQMIVYE